MTPWTAAPKLELFAHLNTMHTTLLSSDQAGFDWINYYQPDAQELEEMSRHFNISSLLIQDVMQAEHLPKVEPLNEKEGFFLIARISDPESRDFTNIQTVSRKLAIFYKQGELVTIHRGNFPWIRELPSKLNQSKTPLTGYLVVCKLLKECFRSFEPVVLKLSEDLDFFEQKLFSNEKFPPFAKSLYSIRRKAGVLKRLFQVSQPILEFLRDSADNQEIAQDTIDMFTRVDTLIEDLNDKSASLINLNLSISSQRSNEAMRFLTVYSAFFMPLTFLVGVYGMNFRFMPELEIWWAYPLVWIVMVGLAAVHFLWFRRKGWM